MTHRSLSSIPRRHAFSLVETMLAVALLGLVLDAGVDLFNASFHATHESELAANQNSTMDSALWVLRQDAWAAGRISVTDPHTVQLLAPDGTAILWRIDPTGAIHRTLGQAGRKWPAIAKDWKFRSTGPSLIVTDSSPPEPQDLQLVSQLLLARRTP
jgi:type II secretory pathway pseudopilin PulG